MTHFALILNVNPEGFSLLHRIVDHVTERTAEMASSEMELNSILLEVDAVRTAALDFLLLADTLLPEWDVSVHQGCIDAT